MPLIRAKEQLSAHSLSSTFSQRLVISPGGAKPGAGGRAVQTEGDWQLVESYSVMGISMHDGAGVAAV